MVAIGWLVFRWINRWAERERLKAMLGLGLRQGSLILLGQRMFKVLVAIVIGLTTFKILGFDMTTAVAGLGITSIAIAFAAQKSLENLFGGIMVLSDEVIRVGETCRLGDKVGIPLVINARTDALRFATGDDEAKFHEAVRRAVAYRDAGADCVYPMGLTDGISIRRFVKELDFPINVMVRKGLPPVTELESLGVTRLSFGPSASYAAMGLLKRAAKEVLQKGTYQNLVDGAISFDELNSLAIPTRDSKSSER